MANRKNSNHAPPDEEIRVQAREERDAEWIKKLFEVGWSIERIAGLMNLDLEIVEDVTETKRKTFFDKCNEFFNLGDVRNTRCYKDMQKLAREDTLHQVFLSMSKHGLTDETIAKTMKMKVNTVKRILRKRPTS